MKSITLPMFYLVKLFCEGLSFSQAIVVMLASAVVFATWLKWHVLHMFILCLAVTFFVITPREFVARLVARAKELSIHWQRAKMRVAPAKR